MTGPGAPTLGPGTAQRLHAALLSLSLSFIEEEGRSQHLGAGCGCSRCHRLLRGSDREEERHFLLYCVLRDLLSTSS